MSLWFYAINTYIKPIKVNSYMCFLLEHIHKEVFGNAFAKFEVKMIHCMAIFILGDVHVHTRCCYHISLGAVTNCQQQQLVLEFSAIHVGS